MPDDPTPNERHSTAARIIQNRLIERIAQMKPEQFASLSADQIVAIWERAVRVEREASQPTPAELAKMVGYTEEDLASDQEG